MFDVPGRLARTGLRTTRPDLNELCEGGEKTQLLNATATDGKAVHFHQHTTETPRWPTVQAQRQTRSRQSLRNFELR